MRVPFTASRPVAAARAYVTAHGIYDLTVNGTRPDDRVLAPEHTPYGAIQLYQTYDITALVSAGGNALGVVLADGWWTGRIGTTGDSCQYGTTLGLLLDVELAYVDGTCERFSAEHGRSHEGPVRRADLFVGEAYDARRELGAWDRPGYDDAAWLPVRRVPAAPGALIGQDFEPVRPFEPFSPARILTAPNGDTVLDAGQVVAGVVEIRLSSRAGHVITLEHGETLDADGNFFNGILNDNKDQTDVYTTRDGYQEHRPRFTYHGFRYVRISGWPGEPALENFRIVPYAAAMDDLGDFSTSDERLNQLQSNIRWSQIGNTVSIPTDCPSREKAGWTGDVAVYAPTMCFLRGAHAFLRSWLRSLRAEQLTTGAVPMIVPYLKAYRTFLKDQLGSDTSSGWGDAVILAPLALWRAYGDKRALEENYPAMRAWLAYIEQRARTQHPAGFEGWSPEDRVPAAVARLVELIEQNGRRLDTGFLSVPFLLDVLCDQGHADVAYRLMFQDRCPSWLYEVDHGATTLWESWGAIAEDGTASSYSYNHYAFGCVGDWLYRRIGGLAAVEAGWRRFRVEPALDCGLARAAVSEETPYGRATVSWEIVGTQGDDDPQCGYRTAFVQVDVPPNTRAEIRLPGMPEQTVKSGHHVFLTRTERRA